MILGGSFAYIVVIRCVECMPMSGEVERNDEAIDAFMIFFFAMDSKARHSESDAGLPTLIRDHEFLNAGR